MRSLLNILGVLSLLLVSALASPDAHGENDRFLTPALKSNPHISGVRTSRRDLFSRQSCDTGQEECSNHCCSSLDTCCENSCTPLGGECCSDGLSCGAGDSCCGDGCMPSLASCCGDGAYCTLSMGSCEEVDGEWLCRSFGGSDQAGAFEAPAWGAIGGLLAVGFGAIRAL
ncbi:uncharacterized protein BDV17DRAFT_285584 [Aspergillus undulatus]|uniref:uncharacterized protein n=1 Tax=Aspergillus undulatus TaxID=1810928 RepID=UPI003CCD37D2